MIAVINFINHLILNLRKQKNMRTSLTLLIFATLFVVSCSKDKVNDLYPDQNSDSLYMDSVDYETSLNTDDSLYMAQPLENTNDIDNTQTQMDSMNYNR